MEIMIDEKRKNKLNEILEKYFIKNKSIDGLFDKIIKLCESQLNKDDINIKIIYAIKTNPDISKSKITRMTQFLTIEERDEIIDGLIKSNKIVENQKGQGKKKMKYYRVI